jgi:hypothetical protein
VTVEKKPRKKSLRVTTVLAPNALFLTDGRTIVLLGVEPWPEGEGPTGMRRQACGHLQKMIGREAIVLSNDDGPLDDKSSSPAYVHLANKKFINVRMIAEGYARADRSCDYRHRKRFEAYEAEARAERRGLWGMKE